VLRFFGGRALPGLRQPLEQFWNFRFVIRLSEREDQVVQSGLIFQRETRARFAISRISMGR
jgi:hypothetical protein